MTNSHLDRWAGIIVNGLSGRARIQSSRGLPFRRRFLYIDGFGYKGRYSGNASEILLSGVDLVPTWGSPIIGVQALDKARQFACQRYGFHLETAAIVVEDHDEDFEDLQESFRLASLEPRMSANLPVSRLGDGRIAVIHGDFLAQLEPISQLISDPYTSAFVLLDPYGPKGIPFTAVSRFVSQAGVDVMINFPYQDLRKKIGYLAGQQADIPGSEATLANYDALFGTTTWRDVAIRAYNEVSAENRNEQVEAELTNLYLAQLRTADPTVVVKKIPLRFPDRERTMFYLFLTTHDPTGALALNEVLLEASLTEFVLRWSRQQAKWVHESHQGGQLTFFDVGISTPVPPLRPERAVDIPAMASEIHCLFADHSPTRRDIYAALANTNYFAEDIDRALRHLKRSQRAWFDDLRANTVIRFSNRG